MNTFTLSGQTKVVGNSTARLSLGKAPVPKKAAPYVPKGPANPWKN